MQFSSHFGAFRTRRWQRFAAKLMAMGKVGQAGGLNGLQASNGLTYRPIDSEPRTAAFMENMPKAELHIHVEGSIEPEMAFEIAERNRIKLAYETVEDLKRAFDFNSLESFLNAFDEVQSVLQSSQDFYDGAYAYLRKARSQNVVYAEIKFAPQAHTRRGVSFDIVIEGPYEAQKNAERELGIKSQLKTRTIRVSRAAAT